MTSPVSSRAHADLALAVYLEPHAEGRRVLLLGEAHGDLADRLDRIAAHLEIIDPGAREPSRGEVPELPFDDRAFDLILVCDVAALPEPTSGAVRELHRVLARDGVLALALAGEPSDARRRRGTTPQAALERLLQDEFRHVRLLAQSGLAGYAVGELDARGDDEFSIDSSLVKGQRREPERLLGIGSDARVELEPKLWVEVPAQPAATGPSPAQERAQASLVEELRRAEDEAREALHRESDLLRKLEVERNARLDAEHLVERARSFEQKLLAAEADYDDAVARVRYFESAIAEHEATAHHDRQRREASERELSRLKNDANSAGDRLKRAEHERDAARTELDEASAELSGLEERLVELGKQVRALEHDKKHHETTARDLLEELRRLEHDKTAAVEHDARVAELEAE
ncbi:MAG: methyltransferase domain-containing protein, partial [Polyangiales bacterium]